MRVLVVEDDPSISRFVVRGLREEQYLVDLAEDGRVGERMAHDGDYDAIVLDVLLPGIDGFEVCRRLRANDVDAPVIMLTARDAVSDRIHGLDAGADDYLVKPFAFDELLARIRALSRRGRSRQAKPDLAYGPIAIDPKAHVVRVNGEVLDLSATEYRLLEHFLRHAEAVVSRDQLAEQVWGGDAAALSNVADVYIGYLRRKLKQAGLDTPILHTVRGFGYRLRRDEADAPGGGG